MSNKRSKEELDKCYFATVDSVYRVCRIYFKNNIADVEDAVQTTYMKWLAYEGDFENENHEKAWLLVTASNICKNTLKHWWRRNADIDAIGETGIEDNYETILDENGLISYLEKLPDKQKIAMYLFYYEEYTCKEIAKYMNKKEATIWDYLHKGRMNLKEILKEENYAG